MADEERPRILIAGDDAASVGALAAAATRAGYEAVEADGARRAVELFSRHRPDLVILDAGLEATEGTSVRAEIRRAPGGDAVPILVLTDPGDLAPLSSGCDAGETDFAPKRASWTELAHRVRNMIRGKEAADALRLSEARLAAATRIAQLCRWEWWPRSGRFRCSEDLDRLLGAAPGSFSRLEEILDRVHADDRSGVRLALEEADRLGRSAGFDFRARRADGSPLHLRGRVDPEADLPGRAHRISGTIQNVTESVLAEKTIRSLAHFDSLTGLPNRILFDRHLAIAIKNARRHEEPVAILILDVDHFHRINDTLGHTAGDRLLRAFADRLRHNVRSTDGLTRGEPSGDGGTVARLGGDEYILLLTDIRRDEDAGKVALRILESLKEPFPLDSREIFATASIGISVFPTDGDDAETLLKNADVAMNHAKSSGRNNYQFYNLSMNTSALHRLSMETRLRRAVSQDEFLLCYQPLVDAGSGRILGVEALIRWRHPELGLVLPLEFIPLAEETGLILPIGEWVLRTACAQGRLWHEAGFDRLRVAINLSAQQFQRQTPDAIRRAIVGEGLDPSHVELEITESLLMGEAARMRRTLEEFKTMGVRIAIDDFGTGYSSLSYLKKYPIDVLKIDRSFVRDLVHGPDDKAITVAIIRMARSLRKDVIAEGVETAEQRDFLLEEGCSVMQGFLFSRPVPPEEVSRLLERQRAARGEAGERER